MPAVLLAEQVRFPGCRVVTPAIAAQLESSSRLDVGADSRDDWARRTSRPEEASDVQTLPSGGDGCCVRHLRHHPRADRDRTNQLGSQSLSDHRRLGQAGGHQVYEFSPEGKLLLTLGKPGGNRPGEPADPAFYQPNDVITNDQGEIFICEGHAPDITILSR
jgi:hypothetical protein